MSNPDKIDPLLAEQIAYYRAIAMEYEDHTIPGPGERELDAALDAFRPAGRVLRSWFTGSGLGHAKGSSRNSAMRKTSVMK